MFSFFFFLILEPLLQINSDNSQKIGYPIDAIVFHEKLYVVDQAEDRILIFSLKGDFLRSFGSKGSGPTEFGNAPESISVWDNKLLVTESQRWNFHIYEPDGTFVSKTKRIPSMIYMGDTPVFERYHFRKNPCNGHQYLDIENECSLGTGICDEEIGIHLDESLIKKDSEDGLTYVVKRRGEIEVYEKCRKIKDYYIDVEKFKADIISDKLGNMLIEKIDPNAFKKYLFGVPIYDFLVTSDYLLLLVEQETLQTKYRLPGETTLIIISKQSGHRLKDFTFSFPVNKINFSEGYLCVTSRDDALVNIYMLSNFL